MPAVDILVLGAGSAGESIARDVASAQNTLRVAVIEAQRVGGTCPFVSCMPSKAMPRSASVRRLIDSSVQLAATASRVRLDADGAAFAAAVPRRDQVTGNRNDDEKARALAATGVTLVRGYGAITEPGTVVVNRSPHTWKHLVLATGSVARRR